MGDLETDFMESISDAFTPEESHILFAPHHGRKSGRVPKAWLNTIDPTIIIVGEAPSSDLNYYDGYDTITQNSAGDIVFECLEPISKSFKQHQQGCELHKAQEVVRIVLPARHNTALPLEPGKKALDLPPPRVAT